VISYKDIALQIFFYSSQVAYNCYLLFNGMTEQSKRHSSGMTSPQTCIADNTEQNSLINKQTNIAHITRRVIAHFIPNSVSIATGVSRGIIWLAAFAGPFRKFPYKRKNLTDISYTTQVIANFVPNFVAMATTEGPG